MILVVTGTGTGVGKTVATAALAARAAGSVIVVKPVQTGVLPGEVGDVDDVRRLAGCEVIELVRLPDPLAPDTAARLAGVSLPTVAEHAARIVSLADVYDTVIVEGAGGLLVRLDGDGGTLLDLADSLSASVVVVVAPGLGTLNHTELTVAALRARGIEPSGLIIGARPTDPDPASRCNRDDLPRVTRVPVIAVLPADVGSIERSAFVAAVPGWFTSEALA
ncbi:dethiobiotin synthase [Nocardioides sp. B-3]|uniref:dethiobiotin synthase n=1 Tax=Nocardioides sp. B-3 TaxID=2895565 RepID=UPI0021523C95|nr:dethiobiotin synthase [Nocardioides sp. B-3]UUZ59945.1 dethiobiotin synthase [Nocardioides sp. B-3]